MLSELHFFQEFIAQDNAQALQPALERWEHPVPEALLELLEQAEGKPYASACLLGFLHDHFSFEELERNRRMHRKKQLGLLDWDIEDWSGFFQWETVNGGCRILSYSGDDREVLIPEFLGTLPVRELAQGFFLHAESIKRLMVPKGIQIGSILPREAAALFGRESAGLEIIRLEREHPLPLSEYTPPSPLMEIPEAGNLVAFGQYAFGLDGSPQPVLWKVLRREPGRALLVAGQVLERLPYHHCRSAVLWPGCDLRLWLNEIFIRTAFTEEEQTRLLSVPSSGQPNPVFHTRNGSDSEDRLFLLSPEEWTAYQDLLGEVAATPWAARADGISAVHCPLWMRMPGLNTQYAVVLDKKLNMDYQGRLVNETSVGVLPALWVRI